MGGNKINSLEEITKADLCCGCGLCASIAGPSNVKVEINTAGFFRPNVLRHDLETWQEIKEVCPGIRVSQGGNLNASGEERIWGPTLSVWTGHATDDTVRYRASSGGILSSLLIYLLETKQVDFVLHIGVGADPFLPVIRASQTRQEVLDHAGSRYAPSAPLVNLAELLEKEQGRCALVGKPCDVAGLRAYLQLHPEYMERIVALFSFFCAGIPSLLATYDMSKALGVNKERVKALRYRGYGWPGRATITTKDNQEFSMSYDDSWGKILGPRLQTRCKLCPDGIGEMADIACGDAWYLQGGRPDFEERPGRSVILVRTKKGQQILEGARTAKYLETETFELRQLALIQPYQKMRRAAIQPRLIALKILGRPAPHYDGFYLSQNARKAGAVTFIKQFLGMIYRSLRRSMKK